MKRIVRLTESDLHRIVRRSVNKVLNEGLFDAFRGKKDGNVGQGGQLPKGFYKSQQEAIKYAFTKGNIFMFLAWDRNIGKMYTTKNNAVKLGYGENEWEIENNLKRQGYDIMRVDGYFVQQEKKEKYEPYTSQKSHAGEDYEGGTSSYDAGLR